MSLKEYLKEEVWKRCFYKLDKWYKEDMEGDAPFHYLGAFICLFFVCIAFSIVYTIGYIGIHIYASFVDKKTTLLDRNIGAIFVGLFILLLIIGIFIYCNRNNQPINNVPSQNTTYSKNQAVSNTKPAPKTNNIPNIESIREADFEPYMREIQRRIKNNWEPPLGNESKRVVVLIKIAKDGRLLSRSIVKSSNLPKVDQAALKAVDVTAPFRPLPPDFKGQSIDIQFTFDYTVHNNSRY